MGDDFPKFTAAVVQAAPIFLDREATIDKACRLIEQAGARGARLIVFPETWVPGYPFWLTSALPLQEPLRLFTRLFKNAVEVPSAATEALGFVRPKEGYLDGTFAQSIGLRPKEAAARATQRAEGVAAKVPLRDGEYFVHARGRIRAALSADGVADHIDQLVAELLGSRLD